MGYHQQRPGNDFDYDEIPMNTPVPKHGRLTEQGIPWTGGGRQGLPPSRGPRTPNCYHHPAIYRAEKKYKAATKGLEKVYHGENHKPPYSIFDFAEDVLEHILDYGIDTPFIFKTLKGQPVNIIDNAQLVTLEEVQRVSTIWERTDDLYERENVQWLAIFIFNSVSQNQRDQLKKHPYAQKDGPLLWRALWHLNVSSSLSSTKADQVRLESMKLRDFRGEHVPTCTSKILNQCIQLEKKKALPANINITVCNILMNCTNSIFSQHFQTLQTTFNLDLTLPPWYTELLSEADNLYNMLKIWTHASPR